jgi:hypothetical protein
MKGASRIRKNQCPPFPGGGPPHFLEGVHLPPISFLLFLWSVFYSIFTETFCHNNMYWSIEDYFKTLMWGKHLILFERRHVTSWIDHRRTQYLLYSWIFILWWWINYLICLKVIWRDEYCLAICYMNTKYYYRHDECYFWWWDASELSFDWKYYLIRLYITDCNDEANFSWQQSLKYH